jgi:hypothetical protein
MHKRHGRMIVDRLLHLYSSFSIAMVTSLSLSWGLAARRDDSSHAFGSCFQNSNAGVRAFQAARIYVITRE